MNKEKWKNRLEIAIKCFTTLAIISIGYYSAVKCTEEIEDRNGKVPKYYYVDNTPYRPVTHFKNKCKELKGKAVKQYETEKLSKPLNNYLCPSCVSEKKLEAVNKMINAKKLREEREQEEEKERKKNFRPEDWSDIYYELVSLGMDISAKQFQINTFDDDCVYDYYEKLKKEGYNLPEYNIFRYVIQVGIISELDDE